jgi:1-acyl-sn-glycerol-3-phosphate acyltransferase
MPCIYCEFVKRDGDERRRMNTAENQDANSRKEPPQALIRPSIAEEIARRAVINFRGLCVILLGYFFMTFVAAVCLIARMLLLGGGENFCRLHIIKPTFRLLFKIVGIKVKFPDGEHPLGQAIYLLNHSSTIDNFLVVAMGLSNTRYFLSRRTYKVIPLTITSLLQGTFYTPSQSDRPARVSCFQRAERILRRTGYSTILSPEGKRVCTGEIGPFNKGAFHLATNLKVPIAPVYFYIPHHVNSWTTFNFKPGNIVVELLPMIDTSNWSLDRLEEQRESVRRVYVEHHQKRHQNDTWH